jgi:hypothetical protein
MIKRPNKDSVLAKHKKWLADLQKTKDRLETELLEEARKKEESQLKVSNCIAAALFTFLRLTPNCGCGAVSGP